MKISDAGLDLIKSFEGYHDRLPDGRCRTYLCPAGVPTIGWGCTTGVKMGMIWTREQAEEGLRRELAVFEAAVNRLVTVEINQHQFDACVSLAYNIGVSGFAGSTVLKKINANNFKAAASAFKMWNKATVKGKKVVLRGLVDRRAREATLFLTPVEHSEEPAMPQAVEEGPAKVTPTEVATVGTAAGAAAGSAATQMIAPPAEVTETVTNLGTWQHIITSGQGFITFAGEYWPWLAGFGLTVATLTLIGRRVLR